MRFNSIRARITALATALVAVVLVTAGLSLVLVQRALLTDSLDEALTQRADDIVALLAEDSQPEEFAQGAREGFAQLVAEGGTVLIATPNLRGVPALEIETDPDAMVTMQTVEGLEVDDDRFRVLSRELEGIGVLHVGTSYDVVNESTAVLTASLSATVPIVLALLIALVWWLVGRTLQPVEDIRSEVAEIGSTGLHRRVPDTGSGDEIDRLAGTMNEMLSRLETSVTRQQRFVADASHELRNPLTRVRTALEVGFATSDDVNQELAKDILEDVIGLQHMVEDLLYMARADAGHGRPVFKRVDLDDVVLREARRIRSRERVEVDISRVSAAQVNGDPGQLGRAVRNLLANAERHASSRVEMSLSEADRVAILTLSDDGPGIPPQYVETIFERFTRLDESRNADSGGTGLGLPIAREVAELHGGSLNLIADESTGATFEMRIPLAD
jgi:signal transduction histidine kinase